MAGDRDLEPGAGVEVRVDNSGLHWVDWSDWPPHVAHQMKPGPPWGDLTVVLSENAVNVACAEFVQ